MIKIKQSFIFLLLCHFFLYFVSIPLYAIQNEDKSLPAVIKNSTSTTSPALTNSKKQNLTVGILSYTDKNYLQHSRWKLSFERLNHHPKYFFIPQFLSIEQLNRKLENDELDFIICDAINYLNFKKEYGVLSLLTRNEQYLRDYFTFEGLSVYIKNNNYDIVRFLDLKDKNIAVLTGDTPISKTFLKKFLFKHGLISGININIQTVHELSQILNLLDSGEVDAVITKSGIIEHYYKQQHLSLLKIVNPRHNWQVPFLHSSELIPEWPLAKAWFIDNSLASQVVSLLIDNADAALENEKNESSDNFLEQYHWSIAQNYNVLYELFSLPNDIGFSNHAEHKHFSSQFQYWFSFTIIFFLLIILSMFLRSSRDLNNRLILSKQSLEKEIKQKQYAQEEILSHHDELAHVARLSTMGEMASGLAHELNQPLSAIHTYVQGCIRRIQMGNNEPQEIIKALQLTAQQANRAAGIIQRLRSFVRKSQTHKTYSEINQITREVTTFLESQLKNKNIPLKLELENDLPPVFIDIIQIVQVLVNLIKNAIDSLSAALPEDLSTAVAESTDSSIIISTKQLDDDLIELCVIDNGQGISKDKLMKIFDPFFTTKSSGMGMGLSISRSIIEAHHGKLYAKNNTIQGARFCFTLPLTKEPSASKELSAGKEYEPSASKKPSASKDHRQ